MPSSAANQPADRGDDRSVPEQGVFVTPAESGVTPGIARQDVRSRYTQHSTIEPDLVELVRYRDDQYGDIQPDGSVRLRHRHTLAWALVHKNVEVPFPSAMHSRPQPPPPPPRFCDQVDLMDAHSGARLGGYFDCAREGEKPAR